MRRAHRSPPQKRIVPREKSNKHDTRNEFSGPFHYLVELSLGRLQQTLALGKFPPVALKLREFSEDLKEIFRIDDKFPQ